MRSVLACLLSLSLAALGLAQEMSSDTGYAIALRPLPEPDWRYQLLVGASVEGSGEEEGEGRGRRFFELGLYRTYTTYDFHHPDPFFTHGLAVEVSPGSEPVYGLRYGAWLGIWMFTAGTHVVCYTDGRRRDLRIRPELGFGARAFKLAMGYNARVYRDAGYRPLQPHSMQLSLSVLLGRSARYRKARP